MKTARTRRPKMVKKHKTRRRRRNTPARVWISGVPHASRRSPGAWFWRREIVRQTSDLPPVPGACTVKVVFHLPEKRFSPARPYGPDLDNLVKRLFDALSSTIFSLAGGADSCVIAERVMKRPAASPRDVGVALEIALI